MIIPLFGEALFGETLFAQGLVVVLIIPSFSVGSPYVDFKILQVSVVDGKIIKTNISDIRILKTDIDEVIIHGGN